MTDAATDAGPDAVPDTVDLVAMGAQVAWTSAEAAARLRAGFPAGYGELRELALWLASTSPDGTATSSPSVRCVVVGTPDDAATQLAADLDVGLRQLAAAPHMSSADALRAGIDAADAEVDAGTEILVIAGPEAPADAPLGERTAAAGLVGALSGAEPVALLPRGALATDTRDWVACAQHLRDSRRRLTAARARPGQLLAEVGSASLATLTGLVLRATARRTPLVLDGTAALAAALLCRDIQARAVRWWRAADTSPEPVHTRCCRELGLTSVLNLNTSAGNGTAGLLCLPLLRAAADVGQRR